MAIRSGSGRNLSRRAVPRLDQAHTGDPDFMVEEPALPVQPAAVPNQSPALPHYPVAGNDDGQLIGPDELSNLSSVEAGRMGQVVVASSFSHGDFAQEAPDFLLRPGQLQMVPKVFREGETARPTLEITLEQSERRLAAPQLDLRTRAARSQALDPFHASGAQGVLDNEGLSIHFGQNQRADRGRERGPGIVGGHGWRGDIPGTYSRQGAAALKPADPLMS